METSTVYKVGDASVTKIAERQLGGFEPRRLFPEWNATLAENLGNVELDAAGAFLMSTHSWLVRTPSANVLIDTGGGNQKTRKVAAFNEWNEPYLENLADAGVSPDDMDFVLLTHLHTDHVGWNTVLKDGNWIPTFPNAKYIFSQIEDALFSGPNGSRRPNYMIYEDSVLPVIKAGLAIMATHENVKLKLPEGFAVHPTPGHSPDHWSISYTSHGETALFAGDVIHLPIQVRHPELSSCFSNNPALGCQSRRWALNFSTKHRALFFSSHCTGTSVGRIEPHNGEFEWHPS